MGRKLGSFELSPRDGPSPVRGTVEDVAALDDTQATVRVDVTVASTAPRACRVDRLRLVWPGGERVLRPDNLVVEASATARVSLALRLEPDERQRVLAGKELRAEILAVKWASTGR